MNFTHKARGWNAILGEVNEKTGLATLYVRVENIDEDYCNGQNFAISAWFRACELLELKKAGELSHSGGSVHGEVVPEPVETETE